MLPPNIDRTQLPNSLNHEIEISRHCHLAFAFDTAIDLHQIGS